MVKYPFENNQISTRLIDSELEFLNELVGKLFADQDWTDQSLTMRTILMRIFEVADAKLTKAGQSKPEDLARIKELEHDNNRIEGEFESFKSQLASEREISNKFQTHIQKLETNISTLTEQLAGIDSEKTAITEKVQQLEKYVPSKNELRIQLQPLTAGVLVLYAEKAQLRAKTEVTPGGILTSLFNRYITKRETELPGFPFLVSPEEISALKKQIDNE